VIVVMEKDIDQLDGVSSIREKAASRDFSEVSLRKVAREKGMVSLHQAGLQKALKGITTVEEVMRKP